MAKHVSVNKRKVKLTLAKYRSLEAKRPKRIHKESSQCESNPSPKHIILPANTTNTVNSTYQIYKRSDGLDLSTFRRQSFSSFESPKTISSSIANTLNSRYIYPESLVESSDDISSYKIPMPLLNKNRCVVEDVMCLPENTEVTVLIPKPKQKDNLSSIQSNTYVECERSYFQYGNEKNQQYYMYIGYIHSCPNQIYASIDALTLHQINNALLPERNNGYGITCMLQQCLYNHSFSSTSSHKFKLCIKWSDVLYGRKNGIQIWTHVPQLRDYSNNFKKNQNAITTDEMNDVLGYISDEIFMDKLATTNLLLKYYTVDSKRKSSQTNNNSIVISPSSTINFDRVAYNHVNDIIEDTFYNAIEKCYKSFCKITQPLLSRHDIDKLVSLYKTYLTSHYNLQMEMMGYTQKLQLSRNKHLKDAGYYDRLVFYLYLSQERVRFNQSLTSWGMVTAGAAYAKGENSVDNKAFFGNSTTISTFMKKTCLWRETMTESIHNCLRDHDSIVACIDNNQKGFAMKYQRFGNSNRYIKVTGCVIKKFFYYSTPIIDNQNYTAITYYNQNIPSSFRMSKYELIDGTKEGILDILFDHVRPKNTENQSSHTPLRNYESSDVDFSGKRVRSYHNICNTVNTINLIRMAMAGCYHRKKNQYTFVDFSRDEWMSDNIKSLLRSINSLKGSLLFKCNKLFQKNAIRKWNTNYDDICELIIPKVMLHDEITTDGYGKCIIELLTLHGILIKEKYGAKSFQWKLAENWKKKTIILCLDGLSLDRHRGFCHKLLNLPMSFTRAFQQSKIFQKALSRVIDVSGPLHTAFHILQSIFIVYNCFLKCIQQCLGWKKITYTKVSENYRLCNHMVDIAYEEVFRFLLFTFVSSNDEVVSSLNREEKDELIAIELATQFDSYVNTKSTETTDERFKLLLCFYKLTSVFKLYERAMNTGDAIEMEHIETQFCGIFSLLDKNNYVEIVLSQLEKKYKSLNLKQLQEIRMNVGVRYRGDNEMNKSGQSIHVLDELMENVNMWVKSLPLGDDRESWEVHSPNVMVARRCLLFEKVHYKRGIIDYEKLVESGVTVERECNDSKYVTPRKVVEKQRVFEMIMKYVGSEVSNRTSCPKVMYKCSETLSTPLKSNTHTNMTHDEENDDLDSIFKDINNIAGNNGTVTGTDESIEDSTEILDDFMDNIDREESGNVNLKHHKYALHDIMKLGQNAMRDKNYVLNRMKKSNE